MSHISDASAIKCAVCGEVAVGAFVQHGSYFTRCIACGDEGPATSWFSLSKMMSDPARAVVVDENQHEIEVLAEGKVNEIAGLISKAAHQGKLVRLVVPQQINGAATLTI